MDKHLNKSTITDRLAGDGLFVGLQHVDKTPQIPSTPIRLRPFVAFLK